MESGDMIPDGAHDHVPSTPHRVTAERGGAVGQLDSVTVDGELWVDVALSGG